jgi:hypothetical protein
MRKKLNLESRIKRDFFGIYKECNNSYWYNCGSYLIDGKKYQYDKKMLGKQMLLFDLAKKNSKILEIGVYMGHSILIMLVSNPKLSITGIDIDSRFSPKAINYLKTKYKKSILKFILGDSTTTLKDLKKKNNKFDLFHIDGDHKSLKIFNEIIACTKLSNTKKMKILFDDADMMKSIEKSLTSAFKVEKYIKPKSKYTNLYLEIRLDEISIFKFRLFFYFFYFFELPKIILHFTKVITRKLLLIFIGKKFCNDFGEYIIKSFNNNYLNNFGKKLKNI